MWLTGNTEREEYVRGYHGNVISKIQNAGNSKEKWLFLQQRNNKKQNKEG